MACLADVPAELELQIASYLSSTDLAAYARLGKNQAKVAREHLYSAPMILQPDEGHRVMMLLRTLFALPELINSIRSMSLAVVNCIMPFGIGSKADCSEYKDVQEQLVSRLKQVLGTDECERLWLSRVEKWDSVALHGVLLRLLPNLERLELDCYTRPHGVSYLAADTTDTGFARKLFGLVPQKGEVDQVHFPKLSELHVKCGLLIGATHTLHNLKTLRVGEFATLPHYRISNLVRIQHMDACVSLWQEESPTWSWAPLHRHSAAMSEVKDITLRFWTQAAARESRTHIELSRNPSLAQLLALLHVSKSILETLSVVPIDHSDLSHCQFPTNTAGLVLDCSQFIRLRELTLPFRPSMDTLKDRLPPSLQKLGLLCTSIVSSASVEHILQHRLQHGVFSRLDLFLLSEADVDINHEGWDMFQKACVAVYIWVRQFTLLRGLPV